MRIRDARFVVVDTETTGLPPEGRVVELALVEVGLEREPQIVYSALVDPGCPIPPEASAVHHITDRDVAGKPRLSQVWPKVLGYIGDTILVAHNAEFDPGMLPETGRPWVCSKRLAQHLWPDAPRHSNQVLRYWLGIDVEVGQPHRALGDAIVTAHVFQRELRVYPAPDVAIECLRGEDVIGWRAFWLGLLLHCLLCNGSTELRDFVSQRIPQDWTSSLTELDVRRWYHLVCRNLEKANEVLENWMTT